MKEEWRDVPGCEGYFVVSNKGEIKGIKTNARPFMGKNGYMLATLIMPNEHKIVYVHRVVAQAFLPCSDPKKIEVHHKDCNKLNNCVENLEWATVSENRIDWEKPRTRRKPVDHTPLERKMIVTLYKHLRSCEAVCKISGAPHHLVLNTIREAKDYGELA